MKCLLGWVSLCQATLIYREKKKKKTWLSFTTYSVRKNWALICLQWRGGPLSKSWKIRESWLFEWEVGPSHQSKSIFLKHHLPIFSECEIVTLNTWHQKENNSKQEEKTKCLTSRLILLPRISQVIWINTHTPGGKPTKENQFENVKVFSFNRILRSHDSAPFLIISIFQSEFNKMWLRFTFDSSLKEKES